MEKPQERVDYNLQNIKRFLNFPLRLDRISTCPENAWKHVKSRIQSIILTFVMDQEEKIMEWNVDGETQVFTHVPRMIVTFPGELKTTLKNSVRSELLFNYDPKYFETVKSLGFRSCNFSFTPTFNETLKKIRQALIEIRRPGVADRLDVLAVELATEATISALDTISQKHLPDDRIFAISNYFRFHYRQKINLESLVKQHGMTLRTFYREWNKYYTETPTQYLISLRLNYAMGLLQDPGTRIFEIADRCGFCDPMYFQRCFSRQYGMAPGRYRRTILKI